MSRAIVVSLPQQLQVGATAVHEEKLAYKTSTADQLSIDSLNKRLVEFRRMTNPLIEQQRADWDIVSQAVAEANELQRRLALAVKAADEEELGPIRTITETVSALKRGLDELVVEAPGHAGCDEEIALALADFTQKLYRGFEAASRSERMATCPRRCA